MTVARSRGGGSGRLCRTAPWTRAGRIVAALVAGLVFFGRAAECWGADPTSIDGSELPVLVTTTPGMVRLHVLLPEDVPPGSVEVQLVGRNVVVLAQDIRGRQRRSRSLRLSEAAVEDGAQADYEPDGSLTITLRSARPGGS
jgi:hypothetical protein